jgi:hypothetical protein
MNSLILTPHESRGLLAGTISQIRRDIKPQPNEDHFVGPEMYTRAETDRDGELVPGDEVFGIYSNDGIWGIKCPFKPGQQIYCRETWMPETEQGSWTGGYIHKVENNPVPDTDSKLKWHSPATMPREAARIFLEIEAVRAELVQDITEDDAVRCGVESQLWVMGKTAYPNGYIDNSLVGTKIKWFKDYSKINHWNAFSARESYKTLHNSIHGPGSFEANKWQFVYSVKRIDKLNQ